MHIENVGEYLKKNGIKPSVQRMKIFQYLLDHHTHPTVDDIFQNLSPEMPTLSKTTGSSGLLEHPKNKNEKTNINKI